MHILFDMVQPACRGFFIISLYRQLLIGASIPWALGYWLDHPINPDKSLAQDFITNHLNSEGRLLSSSPLLKVLESCDDVPKFEYLDEVLKDVFENSPKLLIFSSYISVATVITEVSDSVSMLYGRIPPGQIRISRSRQNVHPPRNNI